MRPATQKAAFTARANDFALSVNGGPLSTDLSGAMPAGLASLKLGPGLLRSLMHLPRRVSNTELQQLSA